MRTIATLNSSVRLVVFQFLMKSAQVPRIIPLKRDSEAPPLPPVPGVKVLESTPKLDIFPLAAKIDGGGNYELVDTWQNPHETKWDMSFVRFVFCAKEHVKQDGLNHEFVAKRDGLGETFADLVSQNLWATQGHLNPYFDKGELCVVDKVMMFGCAGRVPNTEVFSGGRDENNRGIGPKVLLSTLSRKLSLKAGEVVLVAPEPILAPPATDGDDDFEDLVRDKNYFMDKRLL